MSIGLSTEVSLILSLILSLTDTSQGIEKKDINCIAYVDCAPEVLQKCS